MFSNFSRTSRWARFSVVAAPVMLLGVFSSGTALRAWTPTSPQVAVAVFGDISSDVGSDVALDASGNVYTTGYFIGTVDFDPGVGVVSLTSAGGRDVFVTKMDSSGNLIWAKIFGGIADDTGASLTVDSAFNFYVGGGFRDTVDFDPGNGVSTATAIANQDGFISKFDSSGNFLWTKTFGGTLDDRVASVAVDGSGNVVSAGYFQITADFDPGAGTSSLTSLGSSDSIAWKLDSMGNFVWVRQLGSSGIDIATAMELSSTGDLFVSGSFIGTGDFDPGLGTANMTSVGIQDAYLVKLNASGNFEWVRQFGGSGADQALGLTVDTAGNVYTIGTFPSSADFDPGVGTELLTSAGSLDVFLVKMDSSGGFVWARQIGGSAADVGNSVKLDATNNVYVTGSFNGTADFDPGVGNANLISAGASDVFVSKLNSSGGFVWAQQFGGSASDIGNAIAVDATNISYVTGSFQGTADFDPAVGVANVTSAGLSDAFVMKLDVVGYPFTSTTTTTSTSSTTSTLAPVTTTAAPTTTAVGNVSNASASTTTTIASGEKVSDSAMPTTGSSTTSFLLWSGLLLLAGALLQARVRFLTNAAPH